MDLKVLSSEELTAELERRWKTLQAPPLYYYGVWPGHQSDHRFYDRHGKDDWEACWRFSAIAADVNFPLQPWDPWDSVAFDPSGSVVVSEKALEEKRQGVFYYRRGEGISLISCWDRSGDRREGSVSSFISSNVISREELLFWAQLQFPDVFARMEAAGIAIEWAT